MMPGSPVLRRVAAPLRALALLLAAVAVALPAFASPPLKPLGYAQGGAVFDTAQAACANYVKSSQGAKAAGAPLYEGQGSIRCFRRESNGDRSSLSTVLVRCPPQAHATSMATCECDPDYVANAGSCVDAQSTLAESSPPPAATPSPAATANACPDAIAPANPVATRMPEVKVPCFAANTLPKEKYGEMDRQLRNQQAGLNRMTVQQYLDGRSAFRQNNRGSAGVAQKARKEYRARLEAELGERYRKAGCGPAQAAKRAAEESAEKMKTLAALHNPDQVAAGVNEIDDFGDRTTNSVVGGNWPNPPSGSRVASIDAAANAIQGNRGTTLLNVVLSRCQ